MTDLPGICRACGGATSAKKYDRCRACAQASTRKDRDWPPQKPGCREWQGCRSGMGYGRRSLPGRKVAVQVHRWVWEHVHGPIPAGMVVMHTCDNPPCFLLAHLRLGTIADNNADMMAKRRGRFPGSWTRQPYNGFQDGEKNHHAKLTDGQVAEIRAVLALGRRGDQVRLAERYGVSKSHITLLKQGKVRA